MLSSSAVELKKQGKNNLFLYELCLEVWTIQEGKENSFSGCEEIIFRNRGNFEGLFFQKAGDDFIHNR